MDQAIARSFARGPAPGTFVLRASPLGGTGGGASVPVLAFRPQWGTAIEPSGAASSSRGQPLIRPFRARRVFVPGAQSSDDLLTGQGTLGLPGTFGTATALPRGAFLIGLVIAQHLPGDHQHLTSHGDAGLH